MTTNDAEATATHLQWEERFRVGLEAIDKDHQKLFELINQLSDTLHQKSEMDVVRSVVKELYEYTFYHFGREEVVMRRHRYPHFLPHKKMHDDFVRQISMVRDRLAAGLELDTSLLELLDYLRGWLVDHILAQDTQLGHFVLDQESAES